MAYRLIKGEFHLFYQGKREVEGQPDGDSLWCETAFLGNVRRDNHADFEYLTTHQHSRSIAGSQWATSETLMDSGRRQYQFVIKSGLDGVDFDADIACVTCRSLQFSITFVNELLAVQRLPSAFLPPVVARGARNVEDQA